MITFNHAHKTDDVLNCLHCTKSIGKNQTHLWVAGKNHTFLKTGQFKYFNRNVMINGNSYTPSK
jgi:hypothetical protein